MDYTESAISSGIAIHVFAHARGFPHFSFYDGGFRTPSNVFLDRFNYSRERIREMARDSSAIPPDPTRLLISLLQQHVDLPHWDTMSDASQGMHSPAPSGLSDASAYTNVSVGLNADPLSDTSDNEVPMEVDTI